MIPCEDIRRLAMDFAAMLEKPWGSYPCCELGANPTGPFPSGATFAAHAWREATHRGRMRQLAMQGRA